VSLFHCQGSSVVCAGIIRGSDGNPFCCKSAEECQVEAHRSSKVTYKNGALYIRAVRSDQSRFKPVLPVDRIPGNTTLEELVGLCQEVDVWVTYFNTLQEQHEQDVLEMDDESTWGEMSIQMAASWAEVNVPVLADLSKARQNINTPRRLKLGALLSVFSESLSEPLGGFESIDLLDESEDGRAKLQGGLLTNGKKSAGISSC
jgi:hypothetical protein